MNTQIHIISNQAVANGAEYIIKLVPLLYQSMLYQQAGLCMYTPTRLTPVDTEKLGNQKYQGSYNHRIEKNKPDAITFSQRYIQNNAPTFGTVYIHIEEFQLLVVEQ